MTLLLAVALAWLQPSALASPPSLERVAVIGASASAGWGVVLPSAKPVEGTQVLHRHIDLADVLPVVLGADLGSVTDHTDAWFFVSPQKVGTAEVNAAIEANPTIVIAIDFLFWYGYGDRGVDGRRHTPEDTASRMALLEEGLATLERFEPLVLVGDLPDVSSAATVKPISLIKPSQVPSPATLQAMNDRIAQWAKDHPQIIIVPLADTVDRMSQEKPLHLNTFEWPTKLRLLQFDQLHPTPLGLVAIAALAAQSLPATIEINTMRRNPIDVIDRLREQTP
jgi:hypothetical protein